MGVGGWREGLYRYPPDTLPGTIFSTLLALEPYPRPNEGLFWLIHEVSQDGSRYGPELTQN